MSKRPVRSVLTPRAQREIDEALVWWVEHRRNHDLADAIADALDRLERFPEIAPPRQRHGRRVTRRYILGRRVGYHLYYRFDGGTIMVVSLWHERRPRPTL